MTPTQMLDGVQARNPEAETALFHAVWKYRDNRSIDKSDAEDIAQDAVLKCWISIQAGEIRNPEALGSFVGTVHRNLKFEWLRRNRRPLLELNEWLPALGPTPEQGAIRNERLMAIAHAISELKDCDRIILLRWVNGETLEKIADSLGEKLSFVKTRHYRAKARIREAFFSHSVPRRRTIPFGRCIKGP